MVAAYSSRGGPKLKEEEKEWLRDQGFPVPEHEHRLASAALEDHSEEEESVEEEPPAEEDTWEEWQPDYMGIPRTSR